MRFHSRNDVCFWLNGVSEGHGLTRSAYIAFLIVLCVIILENNKVISFNKSLVALGGISYSLYLIHVPVIQFIEFYGSSIGVSTEHRSFAIYIRLAPESPDNQYHLNK
ncbi:acyltransferase family protein [Escherichia coli]|nr:acyltransferase family protein [Escherichia coli]